MGYLLDANILSELTRAEPSVRVVRRVRAHLFEIAISSTVLYELRSGVLVLPESKRRRDLRDHIDKFVLPNCEVIPFDERSAEWLASESARLQRIGKPRPVLDGQIAAVAVTNDLTLVTRNIKDFADYEGLRVENWFEEVG